MRRTPEVRVGISGWNYKGWRGVFYPKGLPQRQELEFASCALNSIEINGSFYSLQRPESYRRWHGETPAGFLFSVKGARFITHMKKLRIEVPLANFFASGVLALEEKLGPILWQFPPNFGWNPQRFREFFELLPRSNKEAATIARRHDSKLKTRAWLKIGQERPLRYCVEIRHPSFLVSEFFDLLREFNIAFVFADTAGKWPYAEDLTSDFVYCRLHGDTQLYTSGYSASALDWWAHRLRLWRQRRQPKNATLVSGPTKGKTKPHDVFVYFDNDAKVHAPFDAQQLAQRLCVRWNPVGNTVCQRRRGA
ncbi:MAG: hypothetical protein QOH24_1764 [Verrucomicrobiota bacterium]